MKMEIELTDEQAKKVEILKENGMDIGDAVDALFEMKDMIKSQSTTAVDYRLNKVTQEKAELEKRMEALDEEISFFNKLKDTSLDVDQKFRIVEKKYVAGAKTYDESVGCKTQVQMDKIHIQILDSFSTSPSFLYFFTIL